MVELYIVGMLPGDFYTQNALFKIKEDLRPNILCFEETQADITALLNDAYKKETRTKTQNYFKEILKDPNNKTLNYVSINEIAFYEQLKFFTNLDMKILGLDNPDFDSTEHKEAEDIYFERKNEFLSKILSLEFHEAYEFVQAEYDAVRDCVVSDNSKPYYLVHDSKQLTAYYEARDHDTAKSLRALIVQEEKKENSKDTTIVYFCNVSHFDDGYENLIKQIEDLNPKIMLMCDFL